MLLDGLGQKHGREDLVVAEKAVERAIDRVLESPENRTVGVEATPLASPRAPLRMRSGGRYRIGSS